MAWLGKVSEVIAKAVKYTAFVVIIAETLAFLSERLKSLEDKEVKND